MIADSPATASNLLWHDTECLALRHERSADYLAAIRELVAEERFGGTAGHDFLRTFDDLAAADADDFTAIWTDPAAYFWARTTYQLLGAHFGSVELSSIAASWQQELGLATVEAAAVYQLDSFRLFALALAVRQECALKLDRPLVARLPVAIPGTPWLLDGEGTVEIEGLTADWQECPRVQVGSCELRLQPAIFSLPGIGYGQPLREVGLDYQRERIALAESVLRAVAQYAPQDFEQIAAHMQVLALKPFHLGDYSNVSHSELPGACVLSVLNEPLVMADRLIHEFYHNRLFCVEEQCGPIFDCQRQDAIRERRFYSPWRDEPRALHGILHALYVTQPVWRFWERVRDEELASAQTLAFADDQLRRLPQQHARAVEVLRAHGEFTDEGQALFDAIAANAEQIGGEAARLGPRDVLAYELSDEGDIVPRISEGGRHLFVIETVDDHFKRIDNRLQIDAAPESTARQTPVAA